MGAALTINGVPLVADPAGVLWWPERRLLVVADLHLEKGTAAASRHRTPLPPWDSAETLARLEAVCARLRPRLVVCLGDSFHDDGGPGRLPPALSRRLCDLVAAHDWLWIRGNHDPSPPEGLGGRCETAVVLGALILRHEADGSVPGEVAGHHHPKARVPVRVGARTQPCFFADRRRLLLPAFGAYTGGLNVLDPAIRRLFGAEATALVLSAGRLFRFAAGSLLPEPRQAPAHRLPARAVAGSMVHSPPEPQLPGR